MNEKILVTRSSMPTIDEYIKEISPIWESHWMTNMGVKHQELERELRDYLDVPGVSLFTNGHSALESIFEAMRLEGEVITTPFTFASTTHAIVRKGLTPVFADIKEDDYTINPMSVERLITEKTCAIVPVHVYGNLCDTSAIDAIAKRYGLKVIYDAAHAFGVFKDGLSAASFGDASMFSFHATKVFNTIEGGAVAYRDSSLGKRLREWKNFGIVDAERVAYVGGNAKMNEFCAAMGLCNMRHLPEEIAKRKKIFDYYASALSDVKGVKLCIPPTNVKHNYAYMPILFTAAYGSTRDKVYSALAENDIFARKYFYPLTSMFECYEGMFDGTATPVAQRISENILTVPMYADLPVEAVEAVCNIITHLA